MNRSRAEELVSEYDSDTMMPLGTDTWSKLRTFINWIYNQGYEVVKGKEYDEWQKFKREHEKRMMEMASKNARDAYGGYREDK